MFSVLLPLLCALGPFAVVSGSADVLVSNLGRSSSEPSEGFSGLAIAQSFATGSNAAGYNLESIELRVSVTGSLTEGERKSVGAELWSSRTYNRPDSRIAILTAPSSIATGEIAFTAPPDTVLAAKTRYHLVVFSYGPLTKLKAPITSGTEEDPGAALDGALRTPATAFGRTTHDGSLGNSSLVCV